MKILLIAPPRFNEIATNLPKMVEKNLGFLPPLGLLYIASNIIKNTSHSVSVIDTQVENMSYEDIKREITRLKPDLIGIQVFTFTLIDAINTAKIAKEAGNAHVSLGGPHVNLYPDETIAMPCVDSLVLGEGEYAFLDLIEVLEGKRTIEESQGIYFKNGNKIIKGRPPQFINDLDSLPFPDRSLTPVNKYFSVLSANRPITTMISSRGCPFKCVFCDRPHLGKIFRYRSSKNVVDEMEACAVNYGVKEIFFYDDTFSINRQRTIDVCADILRRGLKIAWDIRARVDTVDEEVLFNLKKAGCQRIHYGVESGNPKVLEALMKKISLDKVREVFKLTRRSGIETLAYFMLGSPGENRSEVMETISFAKKLDADYVQFSITTPFPGTELYRKGLKDGFYKRDYWKEYAIDPTFGFEPEIWPEYFSKKELAELLKRANESFYLRFRYIIQQLRRISSAKEMALRIKLGLAILFGRFAIKSSLFSMLPLETKKIFSKAGLGQANARSG